MLICYAAFKHHWSFFICSMKAAKKLREELKYVEINGVTIQYGYNKKMPQALLKKIIKARIKETDEKLALKKK